MASVKDAGKYLSLADALQTLKKELLEADAKAKTDGTAILQFKECEITLALEFAPGVEFGVNAGIFKVKASGSAKGTHSLTVRYSSLDDSDPIVAGVRSSEAAPDKIPPRRRNKVRR